jgi:hypothetical protein
VNAQNLQKLYPDVTFDILNAGIQNCVYLRV